MKTLFVTYHYLHGNGGGVYASRAYVNAFAELSEEMTLLCPVKDGMAPEGLQAGIRVVPVAYDKPKWIKFLHLLVGRIHRYFGVFGKTLSKGKFDTVVFDACYVSFRLIEKARRAGCRVITIHHNYQCDFVRDNYRFPVKLPLLFWTRLCERDAVRGSNLNLVLTDADGRLLREHYDPEGKADIRVIGVFEYRRESVVRKRQPDDQLFVITGNLGMPQTEIPLMEWLDTCLPVLREEIPDAPVLVAGKDPSDPLVQRCLSAGAEILPSPADMQELLERGTCYICPASMGSGLKLRMMDGLKNGMPVLAHAAAVRGYEPFVDRYVFSYSDPESFREALRRLLAVETDHKDLARLYRSVFSFDAGVERLRNLL